MSKMKSKKHAENVKTNGSSKPMKKKSKHPGKKTSFFPNVKKERIPVKTIFNPPSEAREFSSNWKNLLQTLVSNPEKKQEGAEQAKDVSVKGKRPLKTPSAPEDSQKPVKRLHKPSETAGGPSKGKDSAGHKQFKAEKRKRKEERNDKTLQKKKENAEEVETRTAKPDIWFDDVDPDDVEATLGTEAADIIRKRNGICVDSTEKALVKEHAFEGITRAVAMDCEMVGVGYAGKDSIVARVSIVNQFGKCIYDKYVEPTEKVTDYRTAVSGIRLKDVQNGESVKTVQKEVAEILKGRILVGHAVHNDLKILMLDHPKKMIRDTQKYKPFQERVKSGYPSLRDLCKEILNVQVQKGEHSSVQDAQATMRLYTLVKKQWEVELKVRRSQGREQRIPRAPKQKPD